MSNGFVSSKVAKPTRAGVYKVRYIAKALHDPEDTGHECESFAYWDNILKRWGRCCMGMVIALNVRRTAEFYYHTRQDLDWRAI